MNTILVVSSDSSTFRSWMDKYGSKLYNVSLAHVSKREHALGYDEGTFFVILDDDNHESWIDILGACYRYIPVERLNEAVRGKKSVRVKSS